MESEKKRTFFTILFVAAMDNFGFGLVIVMFAPLLLSPEYHFLPIETPIATRSLYLGFLFAAFPLTQFFGAPILGDYADRVGRKKALYLSTCGVVFGFVLSAISCLFESVFFLIASRLVTGFFAGNLSICMSAIADLSESEKLRSRNFALLTVVWGASWNFSMLLGGYLSDRKIASFFNPSLPFWITAFLTLLTLFAIMKYYTETLLVSEKKKRNVNIIGGFHNIQKSLQIKPVRPFFFVILFWTLGWGLAIQWYGTFGILQYNISQELLSWGLLLQGIFWMIGGSFINPFLLKKFKSLFIALIATFFCILFLIASQFGSHYLWFTTLFWCAAPFSACIISNSLNIASIHAPENIQGKIMGLSQSMMSLGWFIVPFIGGWIGGINSRLFYPAAAGILFLLFLILLTKHLKTRSSTVAE